MTRRYERGIARLAELNGRSGVEVVETLADFAPQFATGLVEFIFGDVYSRPGLDLRTRQIATIASLTTLGHAQPQLEIHIRGGLNAGLTQAEIIEIIGQTAPYAGFPAALNALATARRIFPPPAPATSDVPSVKP